MGSRIDELYEAVRAAMDHDECRSGLDGADITCELTHQAAAYRFAKIARRSPDLVRALVEVYRAAGRFVLNEPWRPQAMREPMRTHYEQARAAIEKVQALDR